MAKDTVSFNPATLTVMIADDHDPIRKGIKRVLVQMGFGEVIECFDGDEAVKVLSKQPVDLLILDLYMRNLSGFEVLEHIRNRAIASDIPILVVTGEASKEEIVKVADLGAEDYLLKPFQTQDLERKIVKTLEKYHSPTPLLAALRAAERAYLMDKSQDALAAFDRALSLDGTSVRAIHGKAMTLVKLGKAREALSLLKDAIRLNPSYHKTHATLADLMIRLEQPREAIESMRRELEINPKQPERQATLAKLLLKEGDAIGAVEHYRVALQEDPKRLTALMGMGHAYAKSENLDKALYYFKRVRRYHPKATKALEAAVQHATLAGEPRKAELLLKDEKAANPDRFDTYIVLAAYMLRQERDDEALVVVNELLAKDPQNVPGLRAKAGILIKKKDFTNATNVLRELLAVAPSAEVYTALGEALIHQGKVPEAIDALTRALSLDAQSGQTMALMAEAHKKSQQWLKAAFLFRRAAQLGAPMERCTGEVRECVAQITSRRNRTRLAS